MQILLALLLPAVALGAVEQVTDQATFKRILAESPAVVVDFFSQSCGPCIMIAPKYKELAKEYEGRVRFLKVDVQQHHVGVQVRSMPTFHFYFQGKLDNQFSGADENGMRTYTAQLDRKAEAADVEVSLGALEAFYKEHDPSKLDNVDEIYEKYPAYKLIAILKKKYGKAPEFTKKNSRRAAKAAGDKAEAGGDKPVDIRKMDMDDLKAEVYRREMAAQEKEEELVLKKNERRREKLGLTSGNAEGTGTSAAAPVRVAILGGGPAGMTAAIYSARAGLKPVVISPAVGGQLMGKGVGVENYPGIMEANGGDIIKLMKSQAAKFQTTFEHELVTSVDLSKRPFVIRTNTSALAAHALIVSTGADSRWLGAPGEDMYRGGGVSSCATCDGFLWREKHCAVIGGGDTAMEDALVLARTSSHVTLIHRRDTFRASHVLQQAVLSNPKITVMWNTTVAEFKGGDCTDEATCMLSHLTLHSTDDPSNTTELAVDAAFVAIGHIPNTDLFTGQLEMTESGYLQTRPDSTHCSVDGVFASGDVADWVYRQAVTSAGSGSQAALDAERWLSEQMIGAPDEEEAEEACHPEDYEGWTMKKIRAELTSMGVDPKAECRGCMEKLFLERQTLKESMMRVINKSRPAKEGKDGGKGERGAAAENQ